MQPASPQHSTITTPPWRLILGIQSLAAQAAWAGLRVMVGYRAAAEGAVAWQLAILTAVFAIPALLAAIPAGRAADRWGGSTLNAWGCVVVVAGLVAMIGLPGLPWLFTACAIIGVGNVMSVMGQQAFVAHLTQGKSSDQAFGFFTAAASAGQAIGPPLATFIAAGATSMVATGTLGGPANSSAPDTTVGLIAMAVIAALGILLHWPMLRTERRIPLASTSRQRNEPGHALRTSRPSERGSSIDLKSVWPALAVSGLVMVCLDMLYTFIPIWALDRGYNPMVAGLLLSLRAAVSMLSRLGLGRMIRRFGRKTLLVATTALAMVGYALLPFANIPTAIALTILIGVGLGVPQPLTMAWAVSLTDITRHGNVLGWLLSANRLAQITVPLGVGALSAPFGVGAVFFANAVLMGVTSLLSWRRGRN